MMAQQMVALAPGDDDFSDVLPCLVDVSNIDEMPLGVGDVFYGTTTMRSTSLPPVDHVEHERVSCTTPPQPPEVRHLPMAARNSVMTAWLVEHDIAFDEGRAGVKEAWKRVQARCRDAARRKRAHDASYSAVRNRLLPALLGWLESGALTKQLSIPSRP